MRKHALLAALLGAAALAGCGDEDTAPSPAAATATIRIVDFVFAPDPATVEVGQRIAIANADDAPHTLTEEGDSASFDSGTIRGKSAGSVTFRRTGTYRYYCQFHATMKGTVTVVR